MTFNAETDISNKERPLFQTEAELVSLKESISSELAELDKDLSELWSERTSSFTVLETIETDELDDEGKPVKITRPAVQPGDGLYDVDPAYNSHIYTDHIGVRKGGTLEYGQEAEQYADKESDSPEVRERNYSYRQKILKLGKKYGFVAHEAGLSSDETDRFYGVKESELEPLEDEVEAMIVFGAAGKSNVARARGAVRDIESGAVKTKKIVLAGCDRETRPNEFVDVKAFNTEAGATEIESMMNAFRDNIAQDPRCLNLINFDESEPELRKVPYGDNLFASTWHSKVLIAGQEVDVYAVSAPYDPARVEGTSALKRANTDETIYASLSVLPEPGGTNVLVSHDAWGPVQADTSKMILELEAGKKTILSNVFYDNRVLATEHGEDIRAAEQVVDEIQKLHRQKTKLLMAIETKLEALRTAA